MLDPAFSVIIPTRNRPQAIAACLAALVEQTVPSDSFEVIVVDDGSRLPLVLDRARWEKAFAFRLIRQPNTGPSGARNRGAEEARGRFLAFTDDDCRPAPAWLETLGNALRHQPDALVGGTSINGLPDDLFATASQLIIDLVYGHFNADAGHAYFFASNNMACGREAFHSIGAFDKDFKMPGAEDREFCDRWRMGERPMLWVREALIEHRHHQGLREFARLHYRYGRGAYRYQAMRKARRSGNMHTDLAFHGSLPKLVLPRLMHLRPAIRLPVVFALGLWQTANAAGFFHEAVLRKLAS